MRRSFARQNRRVSNPVKPAILTFSRSTSKEQPHRKWSYVWRDYGKRDFEATSGLEERIKAGLAPIGEILFSGCMCRACETYWRLIAVMNPARFLTETGLDYKPNPDAENPLQPHTGSVKDGFQMTCLLSSFGAINLRPFFIKKRSDREKGFSADRFWRDSRAKSTIKWRG
jgi:hypothetical protein